jgi:integrase
MNGGKATPARRTRVERNIYRRADGRFEIGYRDSAGKQRWKVIAGGISAARAERDAILGAKGKGEHVLPNPRLRFDDAAVKWLDEQVAELRPTTQAIYRNSIETHLRPRWGRKRLDAITVDDAAKLVRDLRAEGKSEWTISGILKAASRVFKFARRRLHWHGDNPIAGLENSERPKAGTTERRRIFQGQELTRTIASAHEPYRTLFAFAATTGARMSECLGLVWGDLDLSDPQEATVNFIAQVDRAGKRQPLKTEESRRTVELPRSLVSMLLIHRAASAHSQEGSFVFATRTGRALGQRNVLRELRRAMTAASDEDGRPVFPVLHAVDDDGRRLPVPRGAVPNFHAFRHTAASEAIAAGDGAEEVSWQLGHKNSNVTRAVYVQEIKDAERRARRRAKMEDRYGSLLEAVNSNSGQSAENQKGADVVKLSAVRGARQ